jgi:hypothetical protein
VIAYRCGSAPEVVEEGVTGYVVDSIEGAVAAVDRLGSLDRALIRQRFEDRFSVERMARDYLAVYHGAQNVIELPVPPRLPAGIGRPDVAVPAAVATRRSVPSDLSPS